MTDAIEVEGLVKRYGEQLAVDGVSFQARAGEVFGLLGPNGAGKSTSIGCLSGLLRPDAGRARVLGHDVVEEPLLARRALGVVPQELALYEDLTAHENLAYWGAAWGLSGRPLGERVSEVLERTGLADRARQTVRELSGGMKRRLNFGCGVVHRPRVLLCDEPTAGVDPQSRVRLLDLIREETAAGTAVLYTTHYLEEAQALCDRLAVMDAGRVIASGTLDELRARSGERDLLRLTGRFEPAAVRRVFEAMTDVELLSVEASALRLSLAGASARLPRIFALLAESGAEVLETTLTQPNLETLFIELTGRELRQ